MKFNWQNLCIFISIILLSSCRKVIENDAPQVSEKWVKVFDEYLTDVVFSSEQYGLIASSSKVYKTLDFGRSWLSLNPTTGILNIALNSPTIFCLIEQQRVSFTVDGGITQKVQSGNEYFLDAFYISEKKCIINGTSHIWLTEDGGNSIKKVFSYNNFPANFGINKVPLKSFSLIDSSKIMFINDFGDLLESLDQGSTWKVIKSGLNDVHTVQFLTSEIGFYSSRGGFFKTVDGGKNWTRLDVSAVDFRFFDLQKGYRSAPNSIYYTSDGGQTWEKVFQLNNGNITEMFFINENIGWLATSVGLYKMIS